MVLRRLRVLARQSHLSGQRPGTNPTQYQDRYDLKMSWRINDSNLIDAKIYYSEWGYPAASSLYATPSASAGEVGDDTMWGLNYQSIFSDRTFMEVRYTGWKSNDDNLSQTGSMEPAYIDYSPPGGGPTTYWGGVWYPWTYDTSIDQLSVSVTTFADDFIAGDHDFKFGIQASRGESVTQTQVAFGGTYYFHSLRLLRATTTTTRRSRRRTTTAISRSRFRPSPTIRGASTTG